jgi:16S rRNA (uracil1498-N3)-methyltransferase
MPGHRFFVDLAPHLIIGPQSVVALSEADAHHARDVLRLAAGSPITVILRQSGQSFAAVIEELSPAVTARLTAPCESLAQASRVRRILFALCKGDRNDLVCEKATELGVGAVHLFQADRSVVRLDSPADIDKKRTRWVKIAEGAAKQCGRSSVPEVLVSRSLKEALAAEPMEANERLMFCSLAADSKELRAVSHPAGFIHLCVGPEGDFSPAEESQLLAHGGEAITLGPTVLRSETAAIAAIAMAGGIWGYSIE